MTNKEAPKLKKKKIKPNSMVYQFSGGDLWDRYPLSKYNDLGLCLNKIMESAYDHPDESVKSTFDYPDKKTILSGILLIIYQTQISLKN